MVFFFRLVSTSVRTCETPSFPCRSSSAMTGDFSGDAAPALHHQALFLRQVHVACFAADVGLIGLNIAAELPAVLALESQPETREHEPRGLLSHAERATEFVAADAVLAVGEQPEGRQPLVEPDGRVLEDGPDLQRELRPRVHPVALPAANVSQVVDLLGAAARASGHAIRPANGQ